MFNGHNGFFKFLKDLPAENSGNLIVYPGSHWKHASYFKRDGPLSFLDGEGMPRM